MITYRPFRNTDPPAIAEVWRRQSPLRGLARPVTSPALERLVFSKPYFDRQGLILATEGEQVVGFVHAGFGPTPDRSAVSTEVGTTCMLLVAPHPDEQPIARELLARSEAYLRERGVRELIGGGIAPLDPFYLGLYGGSGLPGVLTSHTRMADAFRHAGYGDQQRCVILQRNLRDFRPLVDRHQIQLRRQIQIDVAIDPQPRNWWEACTIGHMDRTQFTAHERSNTIPVAQATFWDMEPLASSWSLNAMGLVELEVAPEHQITGLDIFIVSEALRQFQRQNIEIIETQVMSTDAAAFELFQKLGFREVEQGIVFRRSA